MEEGRISFIQEAFKGFLKCLGLERKGVAGDGEVMSNSPPPQPPLNPATSTSYESLPTPDGQDKTDPLVVVEVLSSHVDKTDITVISIDEVVKTNGSIIAEADYLKLDAAGEPKMSQITSRGISNGGGGKHH